MLAKADVSLSETISLLSGYKIRAAYIVPTATGMEKSIMDATAPVRDFLKENGLHDFDLQPQGTDHKVYLEAEILLPEMAVPTKVSLYRPESKQGDPRIWIYGLTKYARAFNLLVLFAFEGKLYIVNASDKVAMAAIKDPKTPFGRIAKIVSGAISEIAAELLGLLRDRTAGKFIESIRAGDTGIGATLEHLLGIKTNSKKTPDYKGIEIKASRHNPGQLNASNRVNLFSQVPDWGISPYNKAIDVLKNHGYVKDGRLQLYCSLDAIKPNSQDLILSVDEEAHLLKANKRVEDHNQALMIWTMDKLKERLEEKHPESFWVKAETDKSGPRERFRYYKVIHTVQPIASNLDYLLADGTVSLDLTMSQKSENAVRDHGYLFKIWPKDFKSLFPPPLEHDLC